MRAVLNGQYMGISSYHSKKQNCDVPQLLLFDGQEVVKVDSFPLDRVKGVNQMDSVEVPVKILNGQYGLRIFFDENAV